MTIAESAQAAIFIDFENLAIGVEHELPSQAHPVSSLVLERLARTFGRAVVRRAYADWSVAQFGKHQESLALNAFDLIQVKRFGCQQKNAADVRIAVDAMEALITHPRIDVYVVVAGDGDFSPLVKKLREYGKTVVGVGAEATVSKRLMAVCDEYRLWSSLVAVGTLEPRDPAPEEPGLAAARTLLLRALRQSDSTSIEAGWLKNRMLALDPSFDEGRWGFGSFRTLLTALSDTVVVARGRHDLTVTLRHRQTATDTARSNTPSTIADDGRPAPVLRTLRQRGVGMPALHTTRVSLLSTIHRAWQGGEITFVRDISRVLRDQSGGELPNSRIRGPLRTALVQEDVDVIPLVEGPHPQRRLGDCRVAAFDGSDRADWVNRAHVAWLAFAITRLRDQPDLADGLRDALFESCPCQGRKLLDAAFTSAAARVDKWETAG